jgi:hypothetical protein
MTEARVAPRRNTVLSVVIPIVSDTIRTHASVEALAECLEGFSRQRNAPPMELIVPHHGQVEGIDELRRKYPEVVFLSVSEVDIRRRKRGGREHHDVLRARGMLAATGDLIGLVEDHVVPDENWSANTLAAHREEDAVIGGAMENGVDRLLNWAVYFCDFGKYQNPVPAGPSSFASDANVIYKRRSLEKVREAWQRSFREVIVNGKLMALGEKVVLRPDVILYQNRRGLRFGEALRERYIWGRSYAATRNLLLTMPKRMIYAALSPALPFVLTLRIGKVAWERRRFFGKYVAALPIILLLQISWSLGEGMGYLRGLTPEGE